MATFLRKLLDQVLLQFNTLDAQIQFMNSVATNIRLPLSTPTNNIIASFPTYYLNH